MTDSVMQGDYRAALDKASIVAMTDAAGVITHVNEKFCEISRYRPEELLGKTHAVVNSGFHDSDFFRDMWSTIARGQVWRGEIRNRAKDGSLYWVDTTIVPFVDASGVPQRYLAIRTDITARKQIERLIEEERTRRAFAEKMASLGELAAGIAHELGNPLASIRAWLEVIENSLAKGKLRKEDLVATIGTVQKACSRATQIIRGLLAYARDGSNDPFQSVSCSRLLDDVLEYTQIRLKKHQIRLERVPLSEDVQIECRETEISQVLVNLVLNACDAVRELPDRWVRVSAGTTNGNVWVRVTDSGNGIPPEIRGKIMQPFFTTKPIGKGTGLGLSIARSIMSHHHGTLTLDESSPNTSFVITLPRRQPRATSGRATEVTAVL